MRRANQNDRLWQATAELRLRLKVIQGQLDGIAEASLRAEAKAADVRTIDRISARAVKIYDEVSQLNNDLRSASRPRRAATGGPR